MFRRHHLAIIALTVVAGCGPLRPFEELKTGGRTALTQWEYQEAISRLYQSQVLLNLIRMVEYGETPVHFEFSDIQTTITDDASADLGLSFTDGPSGRDIVGTVILPQYDNPVSFMPNISGARKVSILAKAAPVTRKNWIYDWYYQIADQWRAHPQLRWYYAWLADSPQQRPISNAVEIEKNFKLDTEDSGITVFYHGHQFFLRPYIDLDCEEGDGRRRKNGYKSIVPARELGALTTILCQLAESRPADASLEVQIDEIIPFKNQKQLDVIIGSPNPFASSDQKFKNFFGRLAASVAVNPVRLKLSQGAGSAYKSFLVEVMDQRVKTGNPNQQVVRISLLGTPDTSDFSKAVKRWNDLRSGGSNPDAVLNIEANSTNESIIIPTTLVGSLAKRKSKDDKLDEKKLLSAILGELERQNSRAAGS